MDEVKKRIEELKAEIAKILPEPTTLGAMELDDEISKQLTQSAYAWDQEGTLKDFCVFASRNLAQAFLGRVNK